MQENISFKFKFQSEFWDLPPMIDIVVDNELCWTGAIDQVIQTVEFKKSITYGNDHLINIRRYNKDDSQCKILDNGTRLDQYLIIKQLIIDNIDVQNLMWHRSWFEPEYPVLWQQEQQDLGIVLESKVIGETWLGHNGTWYFNFTSPFYQFVINQFR